MFRTKRKIKTAKSLPNLPRSVLDWRARRSWHMKCRSWLAGLFVAALLTLPLHAHHSFAAEYDSNKPITVKGVVRKLAWVNPHAYVYVDVKDDAGKVVTWAFE